MKSSPAMLRQQEIIRRTGKYRKMGMDAKQAYAAAKKEVGGSAVQSRISSRQRPVSRVTRPTRRKKNAGQDGAEIGTADQIGGMVEIYGQALETHARKSSKSCFPGQEFVHDWEKPGTKIYGLPAGTILQLPDGDDYKLTTRCILMCSPKHDLWDLFKQ
jgi:hypothetical protein